MDDFASVCDPQSNEGRERTAGGDPFCFEGSELYDYVASRPSSIRCVVSSPHQRGCVGSRHAVTLPSESGHGELSQ